MAIDPPTPQQTKALPAAAAPPTSSALPALPSIVAAGRSVQVSTSWTCMPPPPPGVGASCQSLLL